MFRSFLFKLQAVFAGLLLWGELGLRGGCSDCGIGSGRGIGRTGPMSRSVGMGRNGHILNDGGGRGRRVRAGVG